MAKIVEVVEAVRPNKQPRGPVVRARLDDAEQALFELEQRTALLALEASEGVDGAERALASHRARVETAERHVAELRVAAALAERLDREADAKMQAGLRADQLGNFRRAMGKRESAMAAVLKAGADMAKAYAEYSQSTLEAGIFVPTGTTVPIVAAGKNGLLGNVFGRCETLILAELYRIGPQRAAGSGRWVLPFARPANPFEDKWSVLPPCLDEFRAANAVILTNVENQVKALDEAAMAAAGESEAA